LLPQWFGRIQVEQTGDCHEVVGETGLVLVVGVDQEFVLHLERQSGPEEFGDQLPATDHGLSVFIPHLV
jgi:hypothetical protein